MRAQSDAQEEIVGWDVMDSRLSRSIDKRIINRLLRVTCEELVISEWRHCWFQMQCKSNRKEKTLNCYMYICS